MAGMRFTFRALFAVQSIRILKNEKLSSAFSLPLNQMRQFDIFVVSAGLSSFNVGYWM